MKWRVMLELVGPDGTVGVHEVGSRAAVAECLPQMIGLTPEEGKHLLAQHPPRHLHGDSNQPASVRRSFWGGSLMASPTSMRSPSTKSAWWVQPSRALSPRYPRSMRL